jgi:sugar phosphate isomerase/epimerase
MILSCSTLCCTLERYPRIQDALEKIRAVGFHTIDLAVFENWQNVNPSLLAQPAENWSEVFMRVVSRVGLNVSSFNCGLSNPLNIFTPESFSQNTREFLALVKLAQAVRCPNLTVQPGNPIAGYDLQTLLEITAENLRSLGKMSQDHGITLSVEGHQGSILEDPEVAGRFIEGLWPGVGFTYDPSHWVMQDIPLPDTESLLDYTYHVHARNAATHQMQAAMSDGTVDFLWLIKALEERDYQGAVSIEYFSDFDADFRQTRILRDLLISLGVD